MVILGSFRRFCSSAGPVPRRFEPRDPLRAVSSSPVAAPAWLSSRFFSLNDAELGSIFVEMITIEGCNSLKDKKLATAFGKGPLDPFVQRAARCGPAFPAVGLALPPDHG
jgi:hypothetical protein